MLLRSKTVRVPLEFTKMETSCLSREQLLNSGMVLEEAAQFHPHPAGIHRNPTMQGARCQVLETRHCRKQTQFLPSGFYDLYKELLKWFSYHLPGAIPNLPDADSPGRRPGDFSAKTAPLILMHGRFGDLWRGRSPSRHAVGWGFLQ